MYEDEAATWPIAAADARVPDPRTVWCWRIRAGDLVARHAALLTSLLSHEEQDRANRFRLPDDRRNYMAAHAGLRLLLASALGGRSDTLEFVVNDNGKPMLGSRALEFNLSHSGDIVLIALAGDLPIGVDVEKTRSMSDRDAIARQFFHPDEVADLMSLSGPEAERAFFRCWTRKEAVAKAIGLGLSLPLDLYRVSCWPDAPARLLALSVAGPPADEWSLIDLTPAEGYAAALAAPVRPIVVRCRTFDIGARMVA